MFWTTSDAIPNNLPADIILFTTDQDLSYEGFNNDFGPLDIGALTKYCRAVKQKLDSLTKPGIRLVHFCASNPNKRANAACLALAYLVVVEKLPADSAWRKLAGIKPPFKEFVDASQCTHSFTMNILDVLRGLEKGLSLGWYDYKTFDLESFEHFKRVENGDLTWVIPHKFIAFAGPFDGGLDDEGLPASSPSQYVPHFKAGNITTVVRLNKKQYDETVFTKEGFMHVDLIYNDGSCPPDDIRDTFLQLAAREPALAVHCKAGLGRTGTLIAIYAMLHYQFPARAFMGWIRTCRPGSILGVQQQYLCDLEGQIAAPSIHLKAMPGFRVTEDMMKEDVGQGQMLNRAKAYRKYSAASTTASQGFNSSVLSVPDA